MLPAKPFEARFTTCSKPPDAFAPMFVQELGIVPDSRALSKRRDVRLVITDQASGRVPEMKVECMSMSVIAFNLNEGKVPVKLVDPRFIFSIDTMPFHCSGIGPLTLVEPRLNSLKKVNDPHNSGSVPLTCVEEKSRVEKNALDHCGSVPLICVEAIRSSQGLQRPG